MSISRRAALLISITLGVFLALVLTGVAYYAYRAGAHELARLISWPNTLLQSFLPCNNIGTAENPVCEGTPLNMLLYVASFPLGVFAYSSLLYVLIRHKVV